MKPEQRLQREVLLAVGRDPRVAIYQNPVGQGFYANVRPQIMTLLSGQRMLREQVDAVLQRSRVTYGLGPGSTDLVGIGLCNCLQCGAAMSGRFVGLELKAERGRLRDSQDRWHEAARARGARVEVVRSVNEALAVMGCES